MAFTNKTHTHTCKGNNVHLRKHASQFVIACQAVAFPSVALCHCSPRFALGCLIVVQLRVQWKLRKLLILRKLVFAMWLLFALLLSILCLSAHRCQLLVSTHIDGQLRLKDCKILFNFLLFYVCVINISIHQYIYNRLNY